MQIKSIRLKNIRSYIDQKIDFPLGTTLLAGDIGCGKSTILMAIDFALFGLKKGEVSGTDLLRHGSSDGLVELAMSVDGRDIAIRRGLKQGSSSISQEGCVLSIDGTAENLTPLELKARVLDMLGYSQELVKKNKPVFRYTVYTPQEEMKQILEEEESRLEILRKIFGIDKYGCIRQNARFFVTELRSMKRELDSYARDLEAKSSEMDKAGVLMDDLREKTYSVRGRLRMLSEELDAKNSKIASVKSALDAQRRTQLLLARKESEYNALQKKAGDIKLELANIESKVQFNMNLVSEMPQGSMDEVVAAIRTLEKDRDDMIRRVASLDSEIDKLSGILSKGICSFCQQEVSDPSTFAVHIEERKSKVIEITQGIDGADKRLDEMKKQKAALERFNAIRRTVEDLLEWKRDKQAEEQRLLVTIDASGRELAQIRQDGSSQDALEQDFRFLESSITALQKDKLEAEKSLSRFEQQAEDTQRLVSSLKKEVEDKQLARKKVEGINSLVSWFDGFSLLMENIEKHVLLTVQNEFDGHFQYWFSILMGDSMSVRIDEQFTPVIEQNGYETLFGNLSGGEKTSVSLAYRLALNKVINVMIDSIRTKDLLILDEPTDGFSTDQLDKVRDVINALGLRQVIIVSHEPKIDTYVENVIRVYKEDHISRVVEN